MEKRSFRVLLIEDDEDDYVLFRDLLSKITTSRYDIEWVKDFGKALRAMASGYHDVCIVDYGLGPRNGIELLREAVAAGCRTPVILLTGKAEYEIDMEAMKAGAADYLIKGQTNALLIERSIRYAIERRQAQEALRESEERFRYLAENTGDVLYRLRYDTMRYDYISPAIKRLTGYSVQEILTNGFSSLVQRIDTPGAKNVPRDVIINSRKGGRIGEFQGYYLIRTKSGDMRWLSDHSLPWYDASSKVVGSVGVLSDITERRQVEEALEESQKQLKILSAKLLTVQEEERCRIAQELHDSIGQTLAAIKFGMETALSAKGKGKEKEVTDSLNGLIPVVQSVIEKVRSMYMALRPTVLDDFGAIAAIDWYCREIGNGQSDIKIHKEINVDETEVPARLKPVIFRVSQEALDNVVRHSRATLVYLCFMKVGGRLDLSIWDNGIGFRADERQLDAGAGGLGLLSMKERVELTGGSFSIRSESGKGTTIRASWPYRP